MGRGRKPTAAILHIARGNPSKLKVADLKSEPVPRGDLTADDPRFALISEAQRAHVADLLRDLPPGVLKSADAGVVVTFAVNFDLMLAAAARLTPETLVVRVSDSRSDRPEFRLNPFFRALRFAAEGMLKAAGEIGATPVARARLRGALGAGGDAEADDPWDAFTREMPPVGKAG